MFEVWQISAFLSAHYFLTGIDSGVTASLRPTQIQFHAVSLWKSSLLLCSCRLMLCTKTSKVQYSDVVYLPTYLLSPLACSPCFLFEIQSLESPFRNDHNFLAQFPPDFFSYNLLSEGAKSARDEMDVVVPLQQRLLLLERSNCPWH